MPTEFLNVSHAWLKKSNISISKEYLEDQLESHPNYPSILSLTDTLDDLQINYDVFKSEKKNTSLLPIPFLAHTKHNEFILVDYSSKNFLENNKVAKNEFLSKWDGIGIAIANNNNKENSTLKDVNRESKLSRKIHYSLFFFFIFFPILIFSHNQNILSFALTLFSASGLYISCIIVSRELGDTNKISKYFCGLKDDDCDKVIRSNTRILGMKLSDGSQIFFSFLWIMFVLLGTTGKSFFFGYLISIVSFPVCCYSIYYQWLIIKKWCKLCLTLDCILLLMNIIAVYALLSSTFSHLFLSSSEALEICFSIFIAFCVWFSFKKIIKQQLEIRILNKGNLKWKRDPILLLNLLRQQNSVDNVLWPDDITLGNKEAPIQIILVSNPLCKPCGQAHTIIHRLLEKYNKLVNITIRFLIIDPFQENKKTVIVSKIIQRHLQCKLESFSQPKDILYDWFRSGNLEEFEREIPLYKNLDVRETLYKHSQWIIRSKIFNTPTIFINGHKLPEYYSIEDIELNLKFLYHQLIEDGANSNLK